MPIKGLTDKKSLARIGKIHLGRKTKNEKGTIYPTPTDYFVVYEDGNTAPEIIKKFKELYGEKPKELDIMFPVNDPEIFFPQWLKRYGGNRLLCKGDGETALETNPQTGEIKQIECKYRNCPYYQKAQCREVANLLFYVQGIPEGVFQIDTSSINSIKKVNTAIEIIKSTNGGRIAGISLKLALRPLNVTVQGKYNKTVYILHLYQPDAEIIPPTVPETEEDIPDIPEDLQEPVPEEIFADVIDDVPEDLFPEELQEDQSKYGPLEVLNVRGFYDKNKKEIYIAQLKDLKGNEYKMIVPKEIKELKGMVIKNYNIKQTSFGIGKLEEIEKYEIAM
ncbi:MAG TPA: hypothetical protein GXX15_10040 [Clostridia bacterium]|nr:hypothetical protein [Clostridia bacterium]